MVDQYCRWVGLYGLCVSTGAKVVRRPCRLAACSLCLNHTAPTRPNKCDESRKLTTRHWEHGWFRCAISKWFAKRSAMRKFPSMSTWHKIGWSLEISAMGICRSSSPERFKIETILPAVQHWMMCSFVTMMEWHGKRTLHPQGYLKSCSLISELLWFLYTCTTWNQRSKA